MHTEIPDGAEVYREAYFRGLQPDPDVWIDQWADEYMRIPRDTGAAEPGQYRTSRTPYAREPTGLVTLGTVMSAYKMGKGMLNVARGTLMGNPNIAQKVIVTNMPVGGLDGGGLDGQGKKGRRGKGRRGRGGRTPIGGGVPASPVGATASRFAPKAMMGKGLGFAKVGAPLALIEAGLIAADTYQNAETRDEKAEGYGNAAGTLAGTLAGAAAGAAIGSVVPVIGTVVGGLIGGFLGSWGGGELGSAVGKAAFGGPDAPTERLLLPEQPSPLRLQPPGDTQMPILGQMAPSVPSGPLIPKAPVAGPALGDVARSLAVAPAAVVAPALLNAAAVVKPEPARIDQQWTFSPTMPVTVKGDVKDPRQLAQELMPYMQQMFQDFSREQARRNLFDAPHV